MAALASEQLQLLEIAPQTSASYDESENDEKPCEMSSILDQNKPEPNGTDLADRGIDEIQAADLRARLKTFAEDWDRSEADIYDEDLPSNIVPGPSKL